MQSGSHLLRASYGLCTVPSDSDELLLLITVAAL